jgi:hypothetical protein
MAPPYFLAQHSFACETGRHAVFLDLKRDKYTAVAPEDVPYLRSTIRGWPKGPDGSAPVDAPILGQLMKEGLLTCRESLGKDATPVFLEPPEKTFWVDNCPWPELNATRLKNFVAAWAITTSMLRTLPLHYIINRIRRRKQRAAPTAMPLDIRAANRLAVVHFALAPIFYSSTGACLLNSLTFVEFFARYKFYPSLVVGVRVEPFAAHAWVQAGSVVLNDTLQSARAYTPIMAI